MFSAMSLPPFGRLSYAPQGKLEKASQEADAKREAIAQRLTAKKAEAKDGMPQTIANVDRLAVMALNPSTACQIAP